MSAGEGCPHCGKPGWDRELVQDPWNYGLCRICSNCGFYEPEDPPFPWVGALIVVALVASLVGSYFFP